MKESEVDMDSTQALLDSTLPDTPDTLDSVLQDSDEEEIFFGNKSSKESKGIYAKCTRRDTICLTEVDTQRRRSFNVTGRQKSRDVLLSQPANKDRKSSSRSSLYSQENSITEEDDEDDVFNDSPIIQGGEITSTVFDECDEIELGVGGHGGESDEIVVEEQQNLSLNVTGRRFRNKKYRKDLKSIVSLPSASKVKEYLEDQDMEGERFTSTGQGLELHDDDEVIRARCEINIETNSRVQSSRVLSCSSEDSNASSELGPKHEGELGLEVEQLEGLGHPVLEESTVSDNYSADMSCISDREEDLQDGDGAEDFDGAKDVIEKNESCQNSRAVIDFDMSELGTAREMLSFEVSGVEPFDKTEEESAIGEEIEPVRYGNEVPFSSDVSYANSTANSGVVTFMAETSVSGVYDSFSDDTQDEFLHDTEVEEKSVVEGENDEFSTCEVDVTDDKFENVKRKIFDGESGMESFILGSVSSELDDVSKVPFSLGRISSCPSSVSGCEFVLGSVVSELGSVVASGNLVQSCDELSLNDGDDSVFARSEARNSTLNYSFDVPGEEYDGETDTDTVENNSGNEMEVESVDDSQECLHDQSDDVFGEGEVECRSVPPQILVTRPSLPNNVPVEDERSSSPEFLPASPDVSARSSYYTAPSSHNATDLSPMFDTTAEEMMLFEMYGESYDDKVEAMSREQKIVLKERLANRGEDEINLVAEKLHKIMQEKARESSVGSTVSPFSLASSTPSFHIPPNPSPPSEPISFSQEGFENKSPLPTPVNIPHIENCAEDVPEFRVPSLRYPTEVTYHLPTSSSLGRMVSISPSPGKKATPWMPPSPSPKYQSAVSPAKPITVSRPPFSRLPMPVNNTPQRVLQTLSTQQMVTSTTPSSAKNRVADMKAAAYAAVASPVAEYVKSNPAPPLVQNVKAKSCQRDLESTLVEVEDKENMENMEKRLSLLPPCPLPPAVYKAGALSEEQMVDVTGPDYAYIPEAYGAVSSSAKVTKHVARVKVGAAQPGLKWNESCLVNDESLNSSPSVARHKAPYKSVLKQTRRDSGLFDESMLEMSVHETKVVRKIARGRGRGRAKN